MDNPEFYSMNDTYPAIVKYKQYMRDIARQFTSSEKDIEQFIETTFAFEKQLAEVIECRDLIDLTTPLRSLSFCFFPSLRLFQSFFHSLSLSWIVSFDCSQVAPPCQCKELIKHTREIVLQLVEALFF